jgi:hypothetical protein
VYFIPLFNWWTETPHNDLLAANAILLYFASLHFLYHVCRSAGRLGDILKDATIVFEGRVGAWLVILLGMLPGLIICFLAALMTAGGQGSFYNSVFLLTHTLNKLLIGLPLIPASLSLVVTWRAKESCFYTLQKRSHD